MSVSVSIRITRASYSTRKVRMQVSPAARGGTWPAVLPRRARGNQRARHEGRGRELHALQRPGALEEERELAHRQLHAARATGLPQQRESSLLQPLLVEAQSGPVPHQNLGSRARPVREEKEMSRERVPPELAGHQRREAVVPRAQIRRLSRPPPPCGRPTPTSTSVASATSSRLPSSSAPPRQSPASPSRSRATARRSRSA